MLTLESGDFFTILRFRFSTLFSMRLATQPCQVFYLLSVSHLIQTNNIEDLKLETLFCPLKNHSQS